MQELTDPKLIMNLCPEISLEAKFSIQVSVVVMGIKEPLRIPTSDLTASESVVFVGVMPGVEFGWFARR